MKKTVGVILATVAAAVVTGCTSYNVQPLADGYKGRKVIIVDNPQVVARDVGPRLETEFKSRGFDAEYHCDYPSVPDDGLVVRYDVRRAFNIWAPKPWVNYINVTVLDKGGTPLAEAVYRHHGGTLSLAFTSLCTCARTKARPLFDELFRDYPRTGEGEF